MTQKSLRKSLGALLIVGSAAISAQAAETPCNLDSLKGSYDFSGAGSLVPMMQETKGGKLSVYLYEVRSVIAYGKMTIDEKAKGKAKIQITSVTEGFPAGTQDGDMTYMVNPDCKGKMDITVPGEDGNPPTKWSYEFLVDKGNGSFSFVQISEGKTLAGQATPTPTPPPAK